MNREDRSFLVAVYRRKPSQTVRDVVKTSCPFSEERAIRCVERWRKEGLYEGPISDPLLGYLTDKGVRKAEAHLRKSKEKLREGDTEEVIKLKQKLFLLEEELKRHRSIEWVLMRQLFQSVWSPSRIAQDELKRMSSEGDSLGRVVETLEGATEAFKRLDNYMAAKLGDIYTGV